MFKKQTWWEKEAEEKSMSVDQYLRLMKLEKENAEMKARLLEWKLEMTRKECEK